MRSWYKNLMQVLLFDSFVNFRNVNYNCYIGSYRYNKIKRVALARTNASALATMWTTHVLCSISATVSNVGYRLVDLYGLAAYSSYIKLSDHIYTSPSSERRPGRCEMNVRPHTQSLLYTLPSFSIVSHQCRCP